jgi:hypothetical protein
MSRVQLGELVVEEAERYYGRMPESDICGDHTDDYLRRFREYHDGLYDYRHGFPFMERVFGTFWERLNIFERDQWETRRKAYCLGWVDARIEEELLGLDARDIWFTRPMPDPPQAWWLDENGHPF